MADEQVLTTGIAHHGASRLPSVDVDGFNIELKDDEGFLGDRASKGAFRKIFDRWRKPLRNTGKDPFGDVPSETISKKTLDDMLIGDDTEASAVAQCDRGLRPGTRLCHPPLSQDQGLGEDRAHRGRRRLSR